MWCDQMMECYVEIKRNEILTHTTIWMRLTNILLSERCQFRKNYKLHDSTYM